MPCPPIQSLKIREALPERNRDEAGEDKESYSFEMGDVLIKHSWERE